LLDNGEPLLWRLRTSSHEVSCPSSVLNSTSRHFVRFHPERHPPSIFLRSLAVSSSSSPAALFHAADAHGVHPFRAFPCQRTLPGSSPGDPLSVFFPMFVRTSAAPSGVSVGWQSVFGLGVLHPAPNRCSLGFSITFTAFLRLGWEARLSTSSTALDLFFGSVLARFRSGSSAFSTRAPGFSRSRERQPS
jgi:hypothetical protein